MKAMKEIIFVALNRAEGPSKDCYAVVFHTTARKPVIKDPHFASAKFVKTDNIKDSVNRQMYVWGLTAPHDSGYDKVDFQINWFGGTSFGGRFDMKFGGVDGNGGLFESLKKRMEFYTLTTRPSWIAESKWQAIKGVCQELSGEAKKILEQCVL